MMADSCRDAIEIAKRATARRILELADIHLYRGGTSAFEEAVEKEFGLDALELPMSPLKSDGWE